MHSADGACERLIIAGEDLTTECGTALIHLEYEDGRVSISAGTGGQAFFGLADPERILVFSGPRVGAAWTDHSVDQVHAAGDAGRTLLFTNAASGFCSYREVEPGTLIVCEANDDAGGDHALTYRTNGLPGFSF